MATKAKGVAAKVDGNGAMSPEEINGYLQGLVRPGTDIPEGLEGVLVSDLRESKQKIAERSTRLDHVAKQLAQLQQEQAQLVTELQRIQGRAECAASALIETEKDRRAKPSTTP